MNLMLGSEFAERVYAAVRMIPEGHVATYGDIAALAGSPGAARAVGNALHVNPDPEYTPCFRVVNAQGKLARNFGFGGITFFASFPLKHKIYSMQNAVVQHCFATVFYYRAKK